MDFVRYARRVVGEVLAVGRAGSLILGDTAAARPCTSLYRAEDILDWHVARSADRLTLTRLVLKDGDRVRVLHLDAGTCTQELWTKTETDWHRTETSQLKRAHAPLNFIPFVFHGPRHSRPDPDKLPLSLLRESGPAPSISPPQKFFALLHLASQEKHSVTARGRRKPPAQHRFRAKPLKSCPGLPIDEASKDMVAGEPKRVGRETVRRPMIDALVAWMPRKTRPLSREATHGKSYGN